MREPVIPSFVVGDGPLRASVEKLAAEGVRLIEVLADNPDTHIDMTNEAAVHALGEALRKNEIEAYSVHCGFSHPSEEAWDISNPESAARRDAVQRIRLVLHSTARLGAHHMILHPGIKQRSADRLAACRASLTELAESAAEMRIPIAVENLPPEYLGGSVSQLMEILDGMDGNWIRYCLDAGHAVLGGDSPADYARAFGDLMIAMHWHWNDGINDCHLYPVPRNAATVELLEVLDEVGFRHPVTVEAVPPEGMTLREMMVCARAEWSPVNAGGLNA